jgi:predicted PhzF superfamily epimerase YddE/YHI9
MNAERHEEAIIVKYYIVDAFSDKLFSGNQAGVCLLDEWLEDAHC